MQDLSVGILQFNQIWQDKQANFERILTFLEAQPQLDLLLLPEMFHTGFSMQVEHADNWADAEGLHFLKAIAGQHNTAIYTSLMIQEHEGFYNRGVFVEPNGKVYCYDKRKAFGLGGEDQFFNPGSQEVIVSYKDWKINLQICYDLRFPELVRNRVDTSGQIAYDVLLYVANWPQKRILHWDALLKARAIENQCYVVACNRVGTDGNELVYNGHSQAIDMFGNYLTAPLEQEGIFVVNLTKNSLSEGRKSLPFLKDA
jgi:predicted amidohydrolase